ncbi:unnamed protein product [Boreogadus saida]
MAKVPSAPDVVLKRLYLSLLIQPQNKPIRSGSELVSLFENTLISTTKRPNRRSDKRRQNQRKQRAEMRGIRGPSQRRTNTRECTHLQMPGFIKETGLPLGRRRQTERQTKGPYLPGSALPVVLRMALARLRHVNEGASFWKRRVFHRWLPARDQHLIDGLTQGLPIPQKPFPSI